MTRKFKTKHSIVFRDQHGQTKDVFYETLTKWKNYLPKLLTPYKGKNDVYNLEEIYLFFKSVPN